MKAFVSAAVLVIAVVSLYFENIHVSVYSHSIILLCEILISVISVAEVIAALLKVKYKRVYISGNLIQLILLALYMVLAAADRTLSGFGFDYIFSNLGAIVVFRNLLILFRVFSRFQRVTLYFENFAANPALTMVLSFAVVIAAGAIFLAMPFAVSDGKPLSFLDSLFTSTSAVCVTGLIVADTAVKFSFWGKLIIMVLIQTGGLGIMILSFSTLFMFRKNVSLENRMLLSYMINEDDMRKLASSVRNIVFLTLLIEAAGAALLFLSWGGGIPAGERLFFSLFHAVSAFCNAGFALFSDSLEQFHSNPAIVFVISALIIAGGISFAVMGDLGRNIVKRIRCTLTGRYEKLSFSTNTSVVISFTFFLLISGTLLVYFFEHGNSMKGQLLHVQYLSAFFQSVTLRTAGFNTIPFTSLAPATLFLMIMYMFAGGASGSTAGGIKVNTLAVIAAYLRSSLKKQETVIIYNREVVHGTVLKAFSVLALALASVCAGFFLLLATEKGEPLSLLFEAVSAFATVGLSAGITSSLTPAGKIVIIILMFTGRLGPLTLVSSIGAEKGGKARHRYPAAELPIG